MFLLFAQQRVVVSGSFRDGTSKAAPGLVFDLREEIDDAVFGLPRSQEQRLVQLFIPVSAAENRFKFQFCIGHLCFPCLSVSNQLLLGFDVFLHGQCQQYKDQDAVGYDFKPKEEE